jgi:hypothetical protein
MSKLDAGDRSLLANERENPLQGPNMRIAPEAQVFGADAGFRRYGRSLRHD